jgi:Ca2+-transporting ATPase
MPEAREEAFDSDVKMMATFHEEDGRYRVAVKGSPEAVLEASSTLKSEEEERELTGEDRERWTARNQEMAEEGLRVLALATKRADDVNAPPYEGLSFLGLVGLLDPPRRKVREAILGCRSAGIKVVMVTGDHPDTARKVAAAVGLIDEGEKVSVIHGKEIKDADALTEEDRHRFLEAPILARVTPRQKLDLITLYQQNHSVVAMTGDGVNDAPALKKADIGVAMGQRGTQVAREAADMVLKDDSFSTIVAAVEQGRVIFENIRKFVNYLLSCNISEIMVVSLASVVNAPLPLLPLQILFLNLVTDVFPALALGAGEGDPAVMKAPPRDPGEPVLARSHWMSIIAYGLAITFSVLGAMALAILWLGMDREKAVTISFLTLAFAQLWHVFNQRNPTSGFLRNEIVRNPYVWGALALCTGLLLLALYLPGLALVLSLIPPSREGWALVLSMSLIPFVLGQVVKVVRGGGRRS